MDDAEWKKKLSKAQYNVLRRHATEAPFSGEFIDKKDNGMETWNRISSVYPPIHTPIVKTQSGGLHIYFRFNKKLHSFSRFTLRGKKIGWDLMNNNRQVVIPNSENEYSWKVSIEDTPIAVMPNWLDEYLTRCKTFE